MRRGVLIFLLALACVAVLASFAVAQCGPGGCPGGTCGQYSGNPNLPRVDFGGWSPSRPLPPAPREDGSLARPRTPDTPDLEKAYRAVVRIQTDDGRGTMSLGSGVAVRWGNRLAVMTAAHVIRDARSVWVLGKNGFIRAGVPQRDTMWDVAVLFPETAVGLPFAELAYRSTGHPKAGEPLYSCGFGPNGLLRVNHGRFTAYRTRSTNRGGPTDWMELSGPSRGGDSGGPVFNRLGEVVGILWGTDGKSTIAVQCGRLHVIMRQAMGPPIEVQAVETVTRKGPRRTVTRTRERTVTVCQHPTPAPPVPIDQARRREGSGLVPICRPRQEAPTPAPHVIVQGDPEVSRKLDVLIQNTTPQPLEPFPDPNSDAVEEEKPSPNVGLLIGLAVAAAVVVAFIALKAGLGKSN